MELMVFFALVHALFGEPAFVLCVQIRRLVLRVVLLVLVIAAVVRNMECKAVDRCVANPWTLPCCRTPTDRDTLVKFMPVLRRRIPRKFCLDFFGHRRYWFWRQRSFSAIDQPSWCHFVSSILQRVACLMCSWRQPGTHSSRPEGTCRIAQQDGMR